ncbi:(2Fe-2S)-binding protein [Bradyrhizobium sp. 186]|uniref:(2Fe-2S)-binding protein n=1 Tax=Bradyrhizobium sp. 186 TaxID=2782654 RepID=UPI002000F90A|nr:(2Fe-2S)-binding protein [Bradyrhizobium sp. 186]UPK38066.1 (2Fe-2S)-binding protein [Bradyrhizobium sp. 186]
MFRRITERPEQAVTITVDGREISAKATDSVAAAMFAAGIAACRTTVVDGRARGPYCMMGVCFDCLVVVDGVGSRQGCMTRVRDGMVVESQKGRREIGR